MGFEEEMEHAAHAGHEGGHGHEKGGMGTQVGITMAALGVVLALASAMLGGSRSEIIATMIEKARTEDQAMATATKYRTMMSQLQQLHALLPSDEAEQKKSDAEIDKLAAEAAPTEVHVIKVQQLTAGQVLNTATPTGSDVLRFVELVREYDKEKEAAHQWAESYTELVDAYEHAVEHYEWAQLAAEFGIVLCSIALLLNKKPVWFGAGAFGLGSVGLLVYAFSTQHSAMDHARKDIEEHKKAYFDLGGHEKHAAGDEALLADIERIEKKPGEKEKEKPAAAH